MTCYASVVLAVALCLCLCLSVISWCSIETSGQTKLVFAMEASFDLS